MNNYVGKFRILEKENTFVELLLYICKDEEAFMQSNITTLTELFRNYIEIEKNIIFKDKLCYFCAIYCLRQLKLISSSFFKKLVFQKNLEDLDINCIEQHLKNCEINLKTL